MILHGLQKFDIVNLQVKMGASFDAELLFSCTVTPHRNCRLKLLKLERIKDFLLLEEEFIQNQERLKPQEEKNEVHTLSSQSVYFYKHICNVAYRSTLSAPS